MYIYRTSGPIYSALTLLTSTDHINHQSSPSVPVLPPPKLPQCTPTPFSRFSLSPSPSQSPPPSTSACTETVTAAATRSSAAPSTQPYAAVSQGFWSIGFYGIPTQWNIRGSVYIDSTCGDAFLGGNNNGNTFMCFNAPQAIYHSAKYVFNGRKRGIVQEGCQTPDTFLLESGVGYDVSAMEEGVLAELIETAETGGEGYLRKFDEYMKSG